MRHHDSWDHDPLEDTAPLTEQELDWLDMLERQDDLFEAGGYDEYVRDCRDISEFDPGGKSAYEKIQGPQY